MLTRKPRMFYVLSGSRPVSSRSPMPFEPHLATADSLGVRYELLDVWDGLASRYVVGAVRRRPGAYCAVQGFGEGAQLLGILPAGERDSAPPPGADGSVRIAPCPASYVAGDGAAPYSSSSSSVIPLLRGLDPDS